MSKLTYSGIPAETMCSGSERIKEMDIVDDLARHGRPVGSMSNFSRLQFDCQMEKIKMYLVSIKTHPDEPIWPFDNMSAQEKKDFRKRVRNFRVRDGDLLRYTTIKKKERKERIAVKVVTERAAQIDILQTSHAGRGNSLSSRSTGGHLGIGKTQTKVTERYWWPNLSQEIREMINTCDNCQRVKRYKLSSVKEELHPIPVPMKVMHQIGIDITHMPEVDGYKYVITAIDYFTKYVEIGKLKKKTATEVTKFIHDNIFCRYGVTKIHITDNGNEFVNQVARELYVRCGVKHRLTSAYHPQANGLVERMNGTTKQMILKSIEEEEDWPEVLSSVAFAYRTSKQSSTKYEPVRLLIGRKPVLPSECIDIDEDIDITQYPDLTPEDVELIEQGVTEENLKTMKQIREDIMLDAHNNIKKSQKSQKLQFDKRNSIKYEIKVGDLVLQMLPRKMQRKGDKLKKKNKGPFVVSNVNENGLVELSDEYGNALQYSVPMSQLSRYFKRKVQIDEDDMSDFQTEGSSRKRTKKENKVPVVLSESDSEEDTKSSTKSYTNDRGNTKSSTNRSTIDRKRKEGNIDSSTNKSAKESTNVSNANKKHMKVTFADKNEVVIIENREEQKENVYVSVHKGRELNSVNENELNENIKQIPRPQHKRRKLQLSDTVIRHKCQTPRSQEEIEKSNRKVPVVSPPRKRKLQLSQEVIRHKKEDKYEYECEEKCEHKYEEKYEHECEEKYEDRKEEDQEWYLPDIVENKTAPTEDVEIIDVEENSSPYDVDVDVALIKLKGDRPPDDVPFKPLSIKTSAHVAPLFGIEVKKITRKYHSQGQILTTKPETEYMDGDGNCLFRSFSYYLTGKQDYHPIVRKFICDFIQLYANVGMMEPFLDGGKGEESGRLYLEGCNMRKLKKWGTDVEITAMAKIAKRDVYIYNPTRSKDGWLRYGAGKAKTNEGIFITNITDAHFNAVIGPFVRK